MSDHVNEAQRQRMNAELREYVHCKPNCSCRALEAVQQAPAVDREALAKLLYNSAPEAGKQGFEWEDWSAYEEETQRTFVRDSYRKQADHIFASGILQDAAEVEARGLEKAADDHERPDPAGRYEVAAWMRARAQQVREGNA